MAKTDTPSIGDSARPGDRKTIVGPGSCLPGKCLAVLVALLTIGYSPPTAAQDVCENEPILSADIVYDRNGRPMVQAALAGQDKYLIVDTGGAKSIIDPETARELDLRMGQFEPDSGLLFNGRDSAPTEIYTDVTGRQSSSYAIVDELQFGERRFGPVEFVVLPLGRYQEDYYGPVGTLGADFLTAYDVAFDFGADVFQLFAQNQCDPPPSLENGDAEASVTVPFAFNRSNHISFPLHLDGQMLTAILDTGSHDTILSLPVAQNVFSIDLNAQDVIRTGELEGLNRASMYRKRFSSLRIEDLLLLDPMIFLLPDLMAPSSPSPNRLSLFQRAPEASAALPDFILGMSVLARYRLHISYGQRKFYLTSAPVD